MLAQSICECSWLALKATTLCGEEESDPRGTRPRGVLVLCVRPEIRGPDGHKSFFLDASDDDRISQRFSKFFFLRLGIKIAWSASAVVAVVVWIGLDFQIGKWRRFESGSKPRALHHPTNSSVTTWCMRVLLVTRTKRRQQIDT